MECMNVQSAAQLREAFPALVPHIDDATTLWQRRCHACEIVSEAMAAMPSQGVYRRYCAQKCLRESPLPHIPHVRH